MTMTTKEIREALKSNTFNVYMRVSPAGLKTYRVVDVRVKLGRAQVKTLVTGRRCNYLWWTVTSVMQIYAQ